MNHAKISYVGATKRILDEITQSVAAMWPDHGFVFVLVAPGKPKRVYVRTNLPEGAAELLTETAEDIRRTERQ